MSNEIYLCLSDLLSEDLSSYEYFTSLPTKLQKKIEKMDVRSFRQMQNAVISLNMDNSSYNF